MTIGELIKQKRESMKMTLEDVGNVVGVSRATVSRWESGDIQKMKYPNAIALAKLLSLDPEVFMPPEVLTREERILINAFRSADDGTKSAVRKLLDI